MLLFEDASSALLAKNRIKNISLAGAKLRPRLLGIKKTRNAKVISYVPWSSLDLAKPIDSSLGIMYPFSPSLRYSYPLSTPAIISQIADAIKRYPALYEEVLNLMNRMNLPSPFEQVESVGVLRAPQLHP